jgi:hypothetical protein
LLEVDVEAGAFVSERLSRIRLDELGVPRFIDDPTAVAPLGRPP